MQVLGWWHYYEVESCGIVLSNYCVQGQTNSGVKRFSKQTQEARDDFLIQFTMIFEILYCRNTFSERNVAVTKLLKLVIQSEDGSDTNYLAFQNNC